MLKKHLITLLLCFVFITMSAQTPQNAAPITFTMEYVGTGPMLPPAPKTPIVPPEVSIDGNVLYFLNSHEAFALTLTDANDNVVYTTDVSSTDTQVTLPASLSGTFELRLYFDIYCFVGEITL